MAKPVRSLAIVAAFGLVAACVTINVYFPEAAAQQVADDFINQVIGGEENKAAKPLEDGFESATRWHWLDLFFPAAYAQANLDAKTPAIQAIQDRMKARFANTLAPHFDSGAVGFTNDALIAIRDASAIALKDRNAVRAAVAEENRDRQAVYREIAVANGHPEWEGQIRTTFAQRWISSARSGWYYQDSSGQWQRK